MKNHTNEKQPTYLLHEENIPQVDLKLIKWKTFESVLGLNILYIGEHQVGKITAIQVGNDLRWCIEVNFLSYISLKPTYLTKDCNLLDAKIQLIQHILSAIDILKTDLIKNSLKEDDAEIFN